jgi:hypothetical protein
MKAPVTFTLCALLAAVNAAFAGPKPPRVYTRTHQPSGSPTKTNAFAPRSGRSNRHVYGAPIQRPIFRMQPKKPTTTPAQRPESRKLANG